MSQTRTWRLVVLLAGGMCASAFADHRESRRPYTLTLDALVGPTGTDVEFRITASGGQALPREAENVLLWSSSRHGRISGARHLRNVPLVDGKGVIAGLSIPAHARVSAIVEVRAAGSRRLQ